MKIIKIAICDEDADILAIISESTKTAFQVRGLKAVTSTFTNPALFLESLKATSYDIVMLELNISGTDGIALGKKLAKSEARPEIIFVSDEENRVFEAIAVRPLSFVRKNKFLKDIVEAVNLYTDQVGNKLEKAIVVQTRDNSKINIKLSEIMYIEGSKNYQKLAMKNAASQLELRATMDSLTDELEKFGFLRIHKGYIVNMRYIANINKELITLEDGIKLPISSRKATEIAREYTAYCKEKGIIVL